MPSADSPNPPVSVSSDAALASALHSDYIDYEVYLEDSFNPILFANSLVQATNDAHDAVVDLDVPAKRLRYDLDEVNSKIKHITDTDYKQLIEIAAQPKSVKDNLPPIKGALDHVNQSYKKLQRDILAPYYSATKLYTALKRLHATTGLLRALTWYLYLARQLAILVKPLGTVTENPRSIRAANLDVLEPNDLLRAGQTLLELKAQINRDSGLRSLHVARTHEASLDRLESSLVSHCQNVIKFYRAKPSANPADDRSPADYTLLVTNACYTLFLLRPNTLASTIQKFHVAQVTASVQELTRSFGTLNLSMGRLSVAFAAAADRALSIYTLNKSLASFTTPTSSTEPLDSNSTSPAAVDSGLSLWQFVSTALDCQSLTQTFWRDLARNLETNVRDFAAGNSNMTKTIRFKNYGTAEEIVAMYCIKPFAKQEDEGRGVIPGEMEVGMLVKALMPLFR